MAAPQDSDMSSADANLVSMRRVWILHISTFFFFFAFGLVIPVLPTHLTNAFGIDLSWVGWVVALMPFAGILVRPWSGWLADAWSRKWLVFLGLILTTIAGLLYFGNFPMFLLGRIFQGLGIAFFAPAAIAMTSDFAPPSKLTGVMSTRSLLLGLGVMLGTASGGFIGDVFGVQAVFTLIVLSQVLFVPFLWTLPETLLEPKRQTWWKGYAQAVRYKPLLAATVGNMGFAAVYAVLQAFYPLILDDAGFSLKVVGTFFGTYSLTSVIFRIFAGPLCERIGAEYVSLLGFMIAIVGLVGLGIVVLPPFAFIFAAIMGVGSGFFLPANLVSVSQSAPKDIRGSAFSLFTLSWDVGGVLGPVIGSLVVALVSPDATLILAGVMAFIVILLFIAIHGKTILQPPTLLRKA